MRRRLSRSRREQLLLEHQSWIVWLVRHWMKTRPRAVQREFSVYENAAMFAFFDSLTRWDPDVAPLKTFVYRRIIGALQDTGRKEDFCSRRFRQLHPDCVQERLPLEKPSPRDPFAVVLARLQVEDLFGGLSERVTRICKQVWLEGVPQKQVAHQERLSKSGVHMILKRARLFLIAKTSTGRRCANALRMYRQTSMKGG